MTEQFDEDATAPDAAPGRDLDPTEPGAPVASYPPPTAGDDPSATPRTPIPPIDSPWVVPPDGPPEAPPTEAPTLVGPPEVIPPSSPYAVSPYGSAAGGEVPPAPGSGSGIGRPRGPRGWLLVAAVAALIGAGVGAGVTAATDNGGNGSVTVQESAAAPGAAVLSGNVSIPQLVKKVLPTVVSIDVKTSQEEDEGTGMILSSNGEVVTNNHVIALANTNGAKITVTESGTTKSVAATLVGTDPNNDVALLKMKGVSNLPTVTLGNSNKAVVGDAVVAIGNALGLQAGTPTVTQGIVSALGRTVTAGDTATDSETLTNLVQTDAAINPGNSGGPLIDTEGQVIAMNTAVAGSDSSGSSAQNIGFAIPSSTIEKLLPELQSGGVKSSSGGALGVDVIDLTAQLRQQYGFTPTSGAVVIDVFPGSPADKAGLQEGDIIVGVNSTTITSITDLTKALGGYSAGQKVSISYYVGDEKHTVSVTLESQAAAKQQQQELGTSGGSGSSGGSLEPNLGG